MESKPRQKLRSTRNLVRVRDVVVAVFRRLRELFPFTSLGIGVSVGALWALMHLAYGEMDLVWLVVGLSALGMSATSLLSVLLAAAWLNWSLRRQDRPASAPLPVGAPEGGDKGQVIETGRASATGFSLSSLAWWPLIQISWSWFDPADAKVTLERGRPGELGALSRLLRLHEVVEARGRGRVESIARKIRVQDAFGLCRITLRHGGRAALTILPHVGRLGSAPLLRSLTGGDERPHPMGVAEGDRLDLRRYAPGDPARFIHWKVFGRTRKLVVRVPERAHSPAERTAAFLVAGTGDEPGAGAARSAIESGVLGSEWVFGADGSPLGTQNPSAALSMIVTSAEHQRSGGADLQSFLRDVEATGPAALILFVPNQPGPWVPFILDALRGRQARARVVVATDGLVEKKDLPLWRRLLLQRGARIEEGDTAGLAEVCRLLATSRVETIVLDRRSGRRLQAPALRAKPAPGAALIGQPR